MVIKCYCQDYLGYVIYEPDSFVVRFEPRNSGSLASALPTELFYFMENYHNKEISKNCIKSINISKISLGKFYVS